MLQHKTAIQRQLISWFRTNRRSLPWRQSYQPYQIWISEIILQQTQMDRGVVYFQRWLARFPDCAAVAAASETEILKYWEGLGYYARARNLHRTAKILLAQYGGEIPCAVDELLALPGIGPYTAAAISSIACNTDIAVVDANVVRVFARLFDIDGPVGQGPGRRRIEDLAADLLPTGQARIFNQALMDIGGMICTAKDPACDRCPIATFCLARLHDRVDERPWRMPGQAKILIEMATGIIAADGRIYIQQRRADDIWGGLWEFPGGRLEEGESPEQAVVREYQEETGRRIEVCRKITTITHFHTKYRVVLHCYGCRLLGKGTDLQLHAAQDGKWIEPADITNFGLPAGHRKLVAHIRSTCPELFIDPCR